MNNLEQYRDRLARIVNDSYDILCQRIHNGRISIDNEASFQLHYSSILKTLGELYEFAEADLFSIELERNAVVAEGAFVKSKSEKARIDIFLKLEDRYTHKKTSCCAIELKFFLKKNHREPNNRYDVFKDLHNLENYGHECDLRYFIIGTDHTHYVSQSYSAGTGDFDFSDRKSYTAGKQLVYKTPKPYDEPLMLSNSYEFKWDRFDDKYYFMKLEVLKRK